MATKQRNRPSRANRLRRQDRRTTLRVPATLEAELSRTARQLGTSENEALVYLAQLGAGAAKRQRALRQVTARRRKAVAGSQGAGTEAFPSPQEARGAILADRTDRS